MIDWGLCRGIYRCHHSQSAYLGLSPFWKPRRAIEDILGQGRTKCAMCKPNVYHQTLRPFRGSDRDQHGTAWNRRTCMPSTPHTPAPTPTASRRGEPLFLCACMYLLKLARQALWNDIVNLVMATRFGMRRPCSRTCGRARLQSDS